jgi:hypothetical protein
MKFPVRADHGSVFFSLSIYEVFDKLGEGFYMYSLMYAPKNRYSLC